MTVARHPVVRLDGKAEPAVNGVIRTGIAVRLRRIGQAFYDNQPQLAAQYAKELYEYKQLNRLRAAR
jgi:hypothetical protein